MTTNVEQRKTDNFRSHHEKALKWVDEKTSAFFEILDQALSGHAQAQDGTGFSSEVLGACLCAALERNKKHLLTGIKDRWSLWVLQNKKFNQVQKEEQRFFVTERLIEFVPDFASLQQGCMVIGATSHSYNPLVETANLVVMAAERNGKLLKSMFSGGMHKNYHQNSHAVSRAVRARNLLSILTFVEKNNGLTISRILLEDKQVINALKKADMGLFERDELLDAVLDLDEKLTQSRPSYTYGYPFFSDSQFKSYQEARRAHQVKDLINLEIGDVDFDKPQARTRKM